MRRWDGRAKRGRADGIHCRWEGLVATRSGGADEQNGAGRTAEHASPSVGIIRRLTWRLYSCYHYFIRTGEGGWNVRSTKQVSVLDALRIRRREMMYALAMARGAGALRGADMWEGVEHAAALVIYEPGK